MLCKIESKKCISALNIKDHDLLKKKRSLSRGLFTIASFVLYGTVGWADLVTTEAPQTQASTQSMNLSISFVPHGLLQLWGTSFNGEGNLLAPVGQTVRSRSGILVRRSEFALVSPNDLGLIWGFMMDPSKSQFAANGQAASDSKILQDLFIGYRFSKDFKVQVGQFHIPTNREGLAPSGDLLFPERSFLGWRTGDMRDMGVALSASRGIFDAQVGVFNGYGNNASTGSGMHEVAGRVEVRVTDSVRAGIWGHSNDGDMEFQISQTTNSGLDLSWEKGAWSAQAEAVYQWTPTAQSGYYLQGAYKWLELNQIALRFDHYQGFSKIDQDETAGELGYTRSFEKSNLKMQTSYKAGQVNLQESRRFFNEFILAVQTSF